MGQTLTFHPVSLPFVAPHHHFLRALNQAVYVCVCVCVCVCDKQLETGTLPRTLTPQYTCVHAYVYTVHHCM